MSLNCAKISQMEKRFDPGKTEKELYDFWESQGYFTPEIDKNKESYCIVMPPPNANGSLHVGHAYFVTLQDIMARWQRMRGKSVLWLPGADHASIATQVTFERELAKKGKTRFDLGRESFYKACFEFTQKNKQKMYLQLKQLGASCDWTREKFTLDEDVTKIGYKTFYQLNKDNLVYRDWRSVSWCPRCATALSDLEVNYKEEDSKLWYISYSLKDSKENIIIATTRPETMLGDTAVAVNPKDKRYKNMIGKIVVLPLINREIPIVADEMVDVEFGTGAVKITPAHDPDDFAVAQRHNLDVISVIGFDAKMTSEAGKDFEGLTTINARNKIIGMLKSKGCLVKEEEYKHRVGVCERCKTVIEPLVSLQWFIKMNDMAKKASDAVKEGEVKIIHKRFEKTYFNWMDNIRDWCISRQLWWGQRLPIWYCGLEGLSQLQKALNPDLVEKYKNSKGCGEVFIGDKPPNKCPKCGNTVYIQDPDTFDTWFSSGQWPYSTLGYPDSKDYKYFYPTSVMETGYEILFFWVARMIMLGIYRTGKIPFKDVYLHGLIRDAFGQKMSKSKPETAIDPTDTIKGYGADALRMSLVFGASAGTDVIATKEKIEGMRNFANKIWNASRFISFILKDAKEFEIDKVSNHKDDVGVLKRYKSVEAKINSDLEKYRFGQALETLYHFLWDDYCSIYIEQTKDRREQALPALLNVLINSLKLLHPFAPFVTEAIYQSLRKQADPKGNSILFKDKALMISVWPSV